MKAVNVPITYYSQRDSQAYGGKHAHRMCFSSVCGMLVNHLRPGVLKGVNGDDQYLQTVFKYGDTTQAPFQVRAMRDYGVTGTFATNGTWATIDAEIDLGYAIGVGVLHHGPASAPTGGGHWILIKGRIVDAKGNPTHYIVHDPYGEMNLISGGYLHSNGKDRVYSKVNLDKRWRVRGAAGWYMKARKA